MPLRRHDSYGQEMDVDLVQWMMEHSQGGHLIRRAVAQCCTLEGCSIHCPACDQGTYKLAQVLQARTRCTLWGTPVNLKKMRKELFELRHEIKQARLQILGPGPAATSAPTPPARGPAGAPRPARRPTTEPPAGMRNQTLHYYYSPRGGSYPYIVGLDGVSAWVRQ